MGTQPGNSLRGGRRKTSRTLLTPCTPLPPRKSTVSSTRSGSRRSARPTRTGSPLVHSRPSAQIASSLLTSPHCQRARPPSGASTLSSHSVGSPRVSRASARAGGAPPSRRKSSAVTRAAASEKKRRLAARPGSARSVSVRELTPGRRVRTPLAACMSASDRARTDPAGPRVERAASRKRRQVAASAPSSPRRWPPTRRRARLGERVWRPTCGGGGGGGAGGAARVAAVARVSARVYMAAGR